ncbi:MAG: hypothetical protein KAS32_16960, partial [Candidatus Peribacteraceae bacterium]|nr:hypothetical protein [Candidatus Peribacteraceae bacterium]
TGLIDQIYHVFMVRLVAGGTITVKAYPNEGDVSTDTLIDAYRWIDFCHTDDLGDLIPCRTVDGVKYYSVVSSLEIISGITLGSWTSIDLSTVVPVHRMGSWLAGT